MFPIGLTYRNPTFSASATLGEILKQAGIKEYKSKKNKNSGNTKRKNKYYYEKYVKKGYEATLNRIQKQKNPPKNMLSPVEKESSSVENFHTEITQEKTVDTKENESEEKAISVTLDFIEDCQKYKKKITSAGDNKVNNYVIPTEKYQNLYRNLGRGIKKSKERIKSKNSIGAEIRLSKHKTQPSIEEFHLKQPEKSTTEKILKRRTKKRLSEVNLRRKPVIAKQSSGDVSKIDKKYLESLMSITKKTQNKKTPTHNNKNNIKTDKTLKSESHLEKKKIPTNMNKDKFQTENLENIQEILNNFEDVPGCLEEGTLPTVVRNLTKSDQLIKSNTKNLASKAKIKEKNGTHSKLTINDVRKKRMPKNKNLKYEVDEFIETSIPGEITEAEVIQELWSRTCNKTSENSLTSGSSANLPETDIKNFDSYKYLSKLVQEEIANIINKSGENPQKGVEKSKSNEIHKKLQKSQQKNSTKIPLLQSEPETKTYQKKQKNSQLPTFLVEDIPKEANLLKKNVKIGSLPSKIVENWSILNRLEQAFLALGSPTFQNQSKETKTPPPTPTTIKNATPKSPKAAKTITNKPPKTKNVSVKKDIKDTKDLLYPDSPQTKNKFPSTGKTSQNIQTKKAKYDRTSTLNEKQRENVPKKDAKIQQLQVNNSKTSEDNENKIKHKNKKKISVEQDENLSAKKSNKKEGQVNSAKAPEDFLKLAKGKPSETNLERKSTFSVIQLASSNAILQPRKSKGCNKSDLNVKICYSKTNEDNKLLTEPNLIGQPKQSKSNGCEEGIKTTAVISHKQLTKTSLKKEPSPERESPKNSEEKASKENLTKPEAVQEKNIESTEILLPANRNGKEESIKTEEKVNNNPEQKINSTNNEKVRVLKKRSILSMHANQICKEPSLPLQQINEKDDTDMFTKDPNFKKDMNSSEITLIIAHSTTSITSTATYFDEFHQKCPSQAGSATVVTKLQKESSDISPMWCSNTIFSSVTECRTEPSELNLENVALKKESWERDLSHYHQIVREIMSQYKRIDGLLKQSEKVNTFSLDDAQSNSKAEAESQLISLKEYRRKIISEFEVLPNFEYKSKILENADGNSYLEDTKRNLTVVKDTETYEDEDVKDCHPKMKKILDSQIYVEPENLVRQVEHKDKFQQKNTSLQDILISKKGEISNPEIERLRSFSTKAFPLQYSHMTFCSSQEASSYKDNYLEYLTSLSGLDCYLQSETEIETS